MKKVYLVLAVIFGLPIAATTAMGQNSAPEALENSDWKSSKLTSSWSTTVTKSPAVTVARKKPHSIGGRSTNVARLQAEAMQISMQHLPRLRPYASNYPRMVSAVRNYWRTNTSNPSASRLTRVIMQHVQRKYRFFVRPKLRAGIARGITKLKSRLRRS